MTIKNKELPNPSQEAVLPQVKKLGDLCGGTQVEKMFLNGAASLFLESGIDTLSVPPSGTCWAAVDETFPGEAGHSFCPL